MLWRTKYKLKAFFRSALWPLPVTASLVSLVLSGVVWRIDRAVGWTLLDYSAKGAIAALAGIFASMMTFLAFVFTILLVAVQFASSNLSPRVLRTALRDRMTKTALALFVSTITFSLVTMSRINEEEGFVPQLAVVVVAVLATISTIQVLFLLDRIARNLRATTLVAQVGREALEVIDDVYPQLLEDAEETGQFESFLGETPSLVVNNTEEFGIVLAIDIIGLAALAQRNNCVIHFLPFVGDFVPRGAPLFRVYGMDEPLDERDLLVSLAIGSERTTEQDPAFGVRILVDIATRALSPGVNDPTTAVIAIDQIYQLLQRPLQTGGQLLGFDLFLPLETLHRISLL